MKSKVTQKRNTKIRSRNTEIENRKIVKKNMTIWLWKEDIYIRVTESFCYTPATNTTLLIDYISILKK